MTLANTELGFDVWHEDGLLTGAELVALVDLTRYPIVFTVRGIRHFAPRFRHVGVDIATVRSAEQFHAAYRRWETVEYALLQARIAATQGREHRALQAIANGDLEAAELLVRALEHRHRANLRSVPPPAN